jgi:hypothetical protein
MRLLLDTCVWGGAVNELRSAGHDGIWAGEWDQDPGVTAEPGRVRIRPPEDESDG